MEQHYAMKFCALKQNENVYDHFVVEAFGEATLHESTRGRWYRAFERGQKLAEFQLCGRKRKMVVTESNMNTFAAVIAEDCHYQFEPC